MRAAPLNPFSVQCLGPGNIEYLFEKADELDDLIGKLAAHGWRGELCGPHGVGKSTLLRMLERNAQAVGLRTAWWQCTDRQRGLRPSWVAAMGRVDVVFLDGAERLRWWQRRWLMTATRVAGVGLVMTTHVALGHGLLVPMRATANQLAALIGRLMPACDHATARDWAEESLSKNGGNAREALFGLYEEFECGALASHARPTSRERLKTAATPLVPSRA